MAVWQNPSIFKKNIALVVCRNLKISLIFFLTDDNCKTKVRIVWCVKFSELSSGCCKSGLFFHLSCVYRNRFFRLFRAKADVSISFLFFIFLFFNTTEKSLTTYVDNDNESTAYFPFFPGNRFSISFLWSQSAKGRRQNPFMNPVDWHDWHILAGNDERIMRQNLNR